MRKTKITLLAVLLVAALLVVATATGGTSSDPLVSKSYVDVTFFDKMISEIGTRADSAIASFKSKYIGKASDAVKIPYRDEILAEAVADEVLSSLQSEQQEQELWFAAAVQAGTSMPPHRICIHFD